MTLSAFDHLRGRVCAGGGLGAGSRYLAQHRDEFVRLSWARRSDAPLELVRERLAVETGWAVQVALIEAHDALVWSDIEPLTRSQCVNVGVAAYAHPSVPAAELVSALDRLENKDAGDLARAVGSERLAQNPAAVAVAVRRSSPWSAANCFQILPDDLAVRAAFCDRIRGYDAADGDEMLNSVRRLEPADDIVEAVTAAMEAGKLSGTQCMFMRLWLHPEQLVGRAASDTGARVVARTILAATSNHERARHAARALSTVAAHHDLVGALYSNTALPPKLIAKLAGGAGFDVSYVVAVIPDDGPDSCELARLCALITASTSPTSEREDAVRKVFSRHRKDETPDGLAQQRAAIAALPTGLRACVQGQLLSIEVLLDSVPAEMACATANPPGELYDMIVAMCETPDVLRIAAGISDGWEGTVIELCAAAREIAAKA